MTSSAKGDADRHRLAALFVDGPHLSDPVEAELRLEDWLADIEPEPSAAMRDLADRFPHAKAILLGVAEASPHLFDLMRADPARAVRLFGCDPGRHLATLIEQTTFAVAAAASETDVMHLLRRMKSEAALLIALCDIGGVWPMMPLTQPLPQLPAPSLQFPLPYLPRQAA